MENLNSVLTDPFFLTMVVANSLAAACASSLSYCLLSILKEFGWKNDRKIRMRIFGYFFLIAFTIIIAFVTLNIFTNLVNHLITKSSESKKYSKELHSSEIEQS